MCKCECVGSVLIACSLLENGLASLTETFHLCSPLKNMADVESFLDWLGGSWFNLAMGKIMR